MKRIGLLGGMSWESTLVYYKRINERVRDMRGGLHSADMVMRSVDFYDVVALQKAGEWDEAGRQLGRAAREIEAAGGDMVLICTNTMHILAKEVANSVHIPLLHIVDVTGRAIAAAGARKPLLLATRYTMEQPFYREKMERDFGFEVMVPDEADRAEVHRVIFDELCQGVVRPESHDAFVEIARRGVARGADCVILGCTEIGLLVSATDFDVPCFDSTLLHADAAVDLALAGVEGPKQGVAAAG